MNYQDFSQYEIAKYLHMVMNENLDLKETLTQNNLAMKHQLSLLEQWNLKVETDKENSKCVVEECQRQIGHLQNENKTLKAVLTASQNDSQSSKFKELDSTITNLFPLAAASFFFNSSISLCLNPKLLVLLSFIPSLMEA